MSVWLRYDACQRSLEFTKKDVTHTQDRSRVLHDSLSLTHSHTHTHTHTHTHAHKRIVTTLGTLESQYALSLFHTHKSDQESCVLMVKMQRTHKTDQKSCRTPDRSPVHGPENHSRQACLFLCPSCSCVLSISTDRSRVVHDCSSVLCVCRIFFCKPQAHGQDAMSPIKKHVSRVKT